MERKTHEINIGGVIRHLPLVRINEKFSIAVLIIFSDVELTKKSAQMLLERAPEFDVILTAEAKGIPLAYEMSRQSGRNYVVARKMSKLYMENPFEIEVKSITTANTQRLFLDEAEAQLLKSKRILIVDDVISTGGSLLAIERLAQVAGGIIAGKMAILAEGVAAARDDIIYLGQIPLFED